MGACVARLSRRSSGRGPVRFLLYFTLLWTGHMFATSEYDYEYSSDFSLLHHAGLARVREDQLLLPRVRRLAPVER